MKTTWRPTRYGYWSFAALAVFLVLGGSQGDDGPPAPRDLRGAAAAVDPTGALTTRQPNSTSQPNSTVAGSRAVIPGADTVEAADAAATAATAEAQAAEEPRTTGVTSTPTATRSDEDRRRYRRRYRNRYPGPIPTPAEWEPPAGPVRIALQAGHWRAAEAPSELSGLRDNGTRWNDVAEWQANLEIARRAGAILDSLGYEVDILPAVVPPGYRAHLFIAIHADGSGDPRASGYRVAAPRRDATGRAEGMAQLLQEQYGAATGLRHLTSATRRMRNYYAFNFRRYEHALHPMTIAVILETGFLTSERDRLVILDDPDRAASGIVDAVRAFPLTARPTVVDRP